MSEQQLPGLVFSFPGTPAHQKKLVEFFSGDSFFKELKGTFICVCVDANVLKSKKVTEAGENLIMLDSSGKKLAAASLDYLSIKDSFGLSKAVMNAFRKGFSTPLKELSSSQIKALKGLSQEEIDAAIKQIETGNFKERLKGRQLLRKNIKQIAPFILGIRLTTSNIELKESCKELLKSDLAIDVIGSPQRQVYRGYACGMASMPADSRAFLNAYTGAA